jgi:hypothetical protein
MRVFKPDIFDDAFDNDRSIARDTGIRIMMGSKWTAHNKRSN